MTSQKLMVMDTPYASNMFGGCPRLNLCQTAGKTIGKLTLLCFINWD
eukprot:CAMPEP_0203792214 /NCGR_PEP_ID=MMETSP0100_2-20121128/5113_1 /ASSEMBLY_ACC=CAM_ASM_000210 /TAXON_ID=96639 /ORGANISM=" , Strain NY0313808BC1" /LENGTH=46 /DNA_ID= /DNA_START= /DNA_END= /DNA_ORIENTATION=